MKRLLFVAVIALMAFSVSAAAQGFGVTAGMNFNSAKIQDVKMDSKAGWNVGVTYALNLPLGFSLQPSLVYTQRAASIEMDLTPDYLSSSDYLSSYRDDLKANVTQMVGSINLPVSVQWGPDLIVARPFIDVTPYVGYSLVNKVKSSIGSATADGSATLEKAGKNAFDYGVGIGAGVNVWKLQAIVRYNWNFGPLGDLRDFTDIGYGDLKVENETFGGISVHLACFF